VRIYTEDELRYRKQFHVRHSEVRKMGKRVKIFQTDKVNISQDDFALLATSFFVWNDDVQAYFN
jgi:CDP-diacylglycerol pyrophosphatase